MAEKRVKVLLAGAECAPFAKIGGLADVLGTLPQELIRLGMDARVILPFHSQIKAKYAEKTEHVADFHIDLGWRKDKYVGVEKLVKDKVTYYFIDSNDYFSGPVYKGGMGEGEQYAFFSRAVLECLDKIGFMPDLLQCNDWHTAVIPMLIKTQYEGRPQGKIKTVYTMHNLMYQGVFSFGTVQDWLNIDSRYYHPDYMELNGCANFVKSALVFADKLSTVSPSYAEEIKTPYYACNLEGMLNKRAGDLVGIVNGIDINEWDPATDPHTPYHFDRNDLTGKRQNKEALYRELGLTVPVDTPLIGMVSRMTEQKGFDLVMRVFDEIMEDDVAIVLVGTGDYKYEHFFWEMERKYKGRVCSYLAYSNAVAHRVYAASDLFLMPSKFEPCGISQMIAMRYGTLPVVRETGGLRDTVFPYDEQNGQGNGFSFANFNAHDMLYVIRYALSVLADEGAHRELVNHALDCDNSFAVSAEKYYTMFMDVLR